MKIAFVCGEYPPGPHGGIGTMTRLLARSLAEAGHSVRVAGVYPASYPAPDYEEDEGVRVWRLREPRNRFGWVPARVALFRLIETWAKGGEIDLVEAPDYQGYTAGWPALPIPVVVRLHGSASYFAAETRRPIKRTAYWIESRALRRADYWCSVSRYTAERTKSLFRLPGGPHAVLYNPVDADDPLRSFHRSTRRVVFTGTLTAKKGVVPLVQAWSGVLGRRRDAELHFFGKDGRNETGGSMREHLQALLPRSARGSVVFHGHVDRGRVLESLHSARAAVFPSFAEAFALAPLEAMAAGCPTISTRRGSGPEMIVEGRDGILVDPGRPDEIAEAILAILGDDALARRLGAAGRRRAKEAFSLPVVVARNEEFFAGCIRGFRPRNVVLHPRRADFPTA
ncbi:MAG TPA: glycosyltransferase family 4 protein [Thermoanaerobaculia bacterium]|nr:glycosyltransferase family 4 protein [Thermoanaerobaculia bacterium]